MKTNRLVFIILLFAISNRAAGHVFLDRAEPRVGAKIHKSPTEVKIWFTGEIEPAFSRIEVFDKDGNQIDKKDSHVDSKDNTLLIVSIPEISSGKYKVAWQAVATDTHKTTGDFQFSIDKVD